MPVVGDVHRAAAARWLPAGFKSSTAAVASAGRPEGTLVHAAMGRDADTALFYGRRGAGMVRPFSHVSTHGGLRDTVLAGVLFMRYLLS